MENRNLVLDPCDHEVFIGYFIFRWFRKQEPGISVSQQMLLLFAVVELIGFSLQRRLYAIYNLQMIVPLFFCVGVCAQFLMNFSSKYNPRPRHVLVIVFLVLMLPRAEVWSPLVNSPLLSPSKFWNGLAEKQWNPIEPAPDEIRAVLRYDPRVLNLLFIKGRTLRDI